MSDHMNPNWRRQHRGLPSERYGKRPPDPKLMSRWDQIAIVCFIVAAVVIVLGVAFTSWGL
jgi:hypothetical protein